MMLCPKAKSSNLVCQGCFKMQTLLVDLILGLEVARLFDIAPTSGVGSLDVTCEPHGIKQRISVAIARIEVYRFVLAQIS
jgi:hypothetical protein